MLTLRKLTTVCFLAAVDPLFSAAGEDAGPPSVPVLRALHVEPASIELRGSNRQQHLLVTGETSAGRLIDVTELAEYVVGDRSVIHSDGSLIVGIKDGVTRLSVRARDQVVEVPVVVTGFDNYP